MNEPHARVRRRYYGSARNEYATYSSGRQHTGWHQIMKLLRGLGRKARR